MAEVKINVVRGEGIGRHEFVRVVWDDPDEGRAEWYKLLDDYEADRWGTTTSADVRAAEARLAELKKGMAAREGFEPHGNEGWYLKEMVRLAGLVRNYLADGQPDQAVIEAERYGYLRSELRIKLAWERAALAGKATKDGARKGGRAPRSKSDSVATRQKPLLDAYWRSRAAGGLHETAMDRAAKATGYSRRQALRLLGPLK